MLWLNAGDVERLLDRVSLIDLIDKGIRDLADGRVLNAREARIDIDEPKSNFVAFPALFGDDGVFTVKVLTASDARLARGQPLIGATIIVVDAVSGAPLCVMDGRLITAARTAAITAVALRSLIEGNVETLCVAGTGIVARMHITALAAVKTIKTILVVSAGGATQRAEDVAAEAREGGLPAVAAADLEAAFAASDAIVTATNQRKPLASEAAFARAKFLAVVGSCRPEATEIPPSLLSSSRLVVDWPERFKGQWEDAVPALSPETMDAIEGLAQVVAGPTRRGDDRRTIFSSSGMAFADGVAALQVFRSAVAGKIGQVLA